MGRKIAVNWQKEMEKIIQEREGEDIPPTLLLHSCCGPCSSSVLERLAPFFRITVFYYNPNISPREEYEHRVKEQKRFTEEFVTQYPLSFCCGDYDVEKFHTMAKGLEKEPEGGTRCTACFSIRLEETARRASREGFDFFATTLTVSPMKNAALLNEIGKEMEKKWGVIWLPSDFKKKNGYQRSVELSREYGMYRQDYCGCIFSRQEREEKKKKEKTVEGKSVFFGKNSHSLFTET